MMVGMGNSRLGIGVGISPVGRAAVVGSGLWLKGLHKGFNGKPAQLNQHGL